MPAEPPTWALVAKPALTVLFLAILWSWESLFPLITGRNHRLRHAGRNIAIAVMNTVVLAVAFGTAAYAVSLWTADRQWGLLHWLEIPWPWRIIPAIVLLDGWLYIWHRMNHLVPFLWRFHRMHHADAEMDVTTATRFHLGEHIGAATLRLALIPLFGVTLVEILIYETLVVAITMFHHANISLGALDRLLCWVVVTPGMHQIHHSRWRPETDSNFATFFSVWDRIARTYRTRAGNEPVELGLDEFDGDRWQTVSGMLWTPFVEGRGRAEIPKVNASAEDGGNRQLRGGETGDRRVIE